MLVSEGQLVMAMEFKSRAGKSIGNNVNNRAEEAVGSAKDILTAYREGRFRRSPAPFLGYFFLLEDRDNVKTPVVNKNHVFRLILCSAAKRKRTRPIQLRTGAFRIAHGTDVSGGLIGSHFRREKGAPAV
jgi:hypothetical protein